MFDRKKRIASDSELINAVRACLGLDPLPGSKPPRKPKVKR